MLELEGLSCRFGETVAVAEVSLRVPEGQMLGIIGRSGAGKTTLLRMINRLQEPSAGAIRFHGQEITRLRGKALRRWRAQCAMIFQHFNLIPRLDVLTNVLMGRLFYRSEMASLLGLFAASERALALELLERHGLLETALKRAGTLSGGQQQRVAICRALMQEPRLILADEPVASLDPRNAQLVMDALRRISREDGISVLVNLHDLRIARSYCDRIVALSAGRVVFDGAPDALTESRAREIYGAPDEESPAFETSHPFAVV